MSSKIVESVKQFYDSVADYFSSSRKWLWPEMLPYINRIRPNDTVLDIGCGNGRLLNGIQKKVSYTGVDFSRMLLAKAKILHPKAHFVLGDVLEENTWQALPKANALFSVAMLHHVPHNKLHFFVDSIYEQLKKGGFAYLSTWNLWQRKYLKYHFMLNSLKLKWEHKNIRYVYIPFQGNSMRLCIAYFKRDLPHQAFLLEKCFLSDKNTYWSGKNIVWVLKKA